MTSRFLLILIPSIIMYSGEIQYAKRRFMDYEKEKRKIVFSRNEFAHLVCFVDGVDSLR